MTATSTRDGDIAVITLDNPPVNGLGHATRQALMAALARFDADAQIRAMVLTGQGRAFCGGADVREFGSPKATMDPILPAVIDAIESCRKPVIAAINGTALGGGLELAMACHYRLARADAQVGLPEVKLGLVPGASGTQRLPRLIGLAAAAQMIVSGALTTAGALRDSGLFDAVIEQAAEPDSDASWQTAVRAFVRRVLDETEAGQPLPRVRDRVIAAPLDDAWRLDVQPLITSALKQGWPAPLRAIELVGLAASEPFDDGVRRERATFLALMQGPESKALRHIFAAERACSKLVGVPADTVARPIGQIGVIGAGTMGAGIAICALDAGLPVHLVETGDAALQRGLTTIRRHYDSAVQKGRLSADAAAARQARLTSGLDMAGLGSADLIIEAVFEDAGVKQQVFEALDRIAKPGAILASNTSYLDLDRIAAFTRRPQDVVGLHFFSPAQVMRLLEVVRGQATAPDVLVTAMTLGKRLGKIAVVAGVCDGFIGNRMLTRYVAAAMELVHAGAAPQQVDQALQAFGLAMGPFRMGDLAGLDIGRAARRRRALDAGTEPVVVAADLLCERGRLGQKTGAGWYRYAEGSRDPLPDPDVDALLAAFRAKRGITPRRFSDEEIVQRCLYALINEGARVLEEGIAARASDIDIVFLNGYGHPRRLGGPMHHAEQIGLATVLSTLQRLAAEPGAEASWQPAALLVERAAAGTWQ